MAKARCRSAIFVAFALVALLVGGPARSQSASDALPSWNDGSAAKTKIVDFVKRVTTEGGADFVPVPQRIATFDNDGTLWCEQPIYFQVAFAFDRVRELSPKHPEWKTTQPFEGVLDNDMKAVAATGEKGMFQIMLAAQAGTTIGEFKQGVTDWLTIAHHPKFNRPYTDLVYQPMLELLEFMRASGFKTFIVSGGDVEFMRAWAEKIYGIPPEQVVGSYLRTRFQTGANGAPELMQEPQIGFVDDGPGKPVGINRFIGHRPIFAFGNSDGDQQMLEWTAAGDGARLVGIVHHTDAEREYAYDRQSPIGKLDKAWDEGVKRGWLIVDMKTDWKIVFPFQR